MWKMKNESKKCTTRRDNLKKCNYKYQVQKTTEICFQLLAYFSWAVLNFSVNKHTTRPNVCISALNLLYKH